MSLAIVAKGPEGVVLACDSRVTLTAELVGQNVRIPATYDNATKLLRVTGQHFVGVVTYGIGAIGGQTPRTAHSFIPELEAELAAEERLSVEEFSKRLSEFYMARWKEHMSEATPVADNMVFLIGGYDKDEPYGRVFEVRIPNNPEPSEQEKGEFGMIWGGQTTFVDRLLQGFDEGVTNAAMAELGTDPAQTRALRDRLRRDLSLAIPYAFLPLQDSIDLAILLLRTTMELQKWIVGVRGVGGMIEVATVTRTDGFDPIQEKKPRGERDIWSK